MMELLIFKIYLDHNTFMHFIHINKAFKLILLS
jgi:hypothetical protein